MKLPHPLNPVHCASTDGCRYLLNGVFLDGDLAVATNGKVAFVASTTREDQDDKRGAIIPPRLAKAAFKQSKKKPKDQTQLVINAPTEAGMLTSTIYEPNGDVVKVQEIQPKNSPYPDVSKVIPDHSKATMTIGIDVKYLTMIAKSMCESQLFLHFNPEKFSESGYSEAVLVTSKNPDALGLIMPISARELRIKNLTPLLTLASRKKAKDEAIKAESAERERLTKEKEEAAASKTAEWLNSNTQ